VTDLHIRYATPADLDLLVPLFDGYRIFYEQPSNPGIAANFLKERLRLRESVILLATAAGEGLGFVQLYPSFSSVAAQRIWILNDLYVTEKARRGGVARALMEAAKEHARFTGAVRLTLSTALTNQKAQRLYESLGYVRDNDYFNYDLKVS
jgi:GNAT superfamily N-acetyltransferase